MSKQRNRRILWLLAIWVAIWPLLQSPNLSAEDTDYILDTETASAEPVTSPESQSEPIENSEEAAGDDPYDMPALSADPNELLARVNGLARSGKHKEVVAELADYEDAVVELEALLEIYLEALLKSDKPDWNSINRLGRALAGKDSKNSLANYAQGMYWQNIKKPDMAKAVTFLGKARTAKKPYPGAAMAYYLAVARRFWQIVVAVVLIPVVIIVKKRRNRAKQPPAIDLSDGNLSESAVSSEEPSAPVLVDNSTSQGEPVTVVSAGHTSSASGLGSKDPTPALEESSETKMTEASSPAATRKVVKVIRKVKTVVKPKENADKDGFITTDEQLAPAPAEVTIAQESIEPEPVLEPTVGPELKPVVEPTPVVTPDFYSAQQTRQQFEGHVGSGKISDVKKPDPDRVGDLIRPQRRSSVQADAELDALWNDLSQKALQGRIVPLARSKEELYGAGSFNNTSRNELDTSDVSIDLSEEAMRDDLIGKLKMLAIADGELREIFAMKNPAHIPHLIEYILTRPEPVRLAFVAREIGYYGDAAVIDILASLLYHEDERVALAAIQGLENSQKPAAALHLCPFLRSEVPLLAQAARTALANFGVNKILQAFQNLFEHPDVRIREAGVFVLSRMKGKAVEELLKKMLQDQSLEVRNKTILAMSYQKNPVYIDCLRGFFRSASDTDKALARKAIVYLQGFVSR